MQRQFGAGARAAAPLAVAVAAFGVTFGVLAREAGFSGPAALVMSLTTFAGGAQFAAASVLAGGRTVAAAVAAAAMLNVRYLPIGISVASALRGPWWLRFAVAQLVVDESWAVAHTGGGRYDRDRLLSAGSVVLFAWAGGTAVGHAASDVLPDPAALGLDAMVPALFLALIVGQVRDRTARSAALVAAALAAALVGAAPAGVPVIAASVVALAGLRAPR